MAAGIAILGPRTRTQSPRWIFVTKPLNRRSRMGTGCVMRPATLNGSPAAAGSAASRRRKRRRRMVVRTITGNASGAMRARGRTVSLSGLAPRGAWHVATRIVHPHCAPPGCTSAHARRCWGQLRRETLCRARGQVKPIRSRVLTECFRPIAIGSLTTCRVC
jgi:hypothetical protein